MCSDGTDTSAAAESALYKEAADDEQKQAENRSNCIERAVK